MATNFIASNAASNRTISEAWAELLVAQRANLCTPDGIRPMGLEEKEFEAHLNRLEDEIFAGVPQNAAEVAIKLRLVLAKDDAGGAWGHRLAYGILPPDDQGAIMMLGEGSTIQEHWRAILELERLSA